MIVGGLVFGATMVGLAATPEETIKERRAGYKHMGENFKAMKEALESGADVKPLAARAAEIVDWAKQIPTMFPPGTDKGGGTHAKPEVWTERAGFDKLAKQLLENAQKLESVAASGDKGAFAAQFKATGAVCGKCHDTYRYKLS
jgi:cytochrome c556